MSGRGSYYAGHSAEDIVARHYVDRGYEVAETCWRSEAGEVDLILRRGDLVVFVEVKSSKTHDMAAARILPAQMARIMGAAEIFVATEPRGALTDMRFDAALVDGTGRVKIIENAFGG